MADAAPLIETEEAKAPPGGEASWIVGAGGVKLRAALFTPPAVSRGGRARGSIVLSGGRTEAIEKYYEFIGECLDRGFVVLAHDWRGQGLSQRALGDPLKGHARGYKAYLDDFRALLGAFADRLPRPWVAVAHSMGGCLTLLAMSHGEDRFAGAILSAPMLGIRTPFPPGVSRLLTTLSLLAGLGGGYTLSGAGKPFDSDFEGNVLTHDPVRHARAWSLVAAEPKLALGAPTWGWIDFALRATAYLARPDALRNITVPVVIVSAEDDKLIDTAAQSAAARHLPQGKFINVPGAYHEILMETDPMRNIFLRALDALTGRVAPTPAEPPKAALTPMPAPTPAPAAADPVATAAPVAPRAEIKPAAPKRAASRSAAAKPSAPKSAAVKPAAPKAAAPKTAAPKASAPKAAAPKTAASKSASSTSASKAKTAGVKASSAKPAAKSAAKPAATSKTATKTAAPKSPATTKPAAKPAAKPAPSTATAKAPAAKKSASAKTTAAPKAAAKPATTKVAAAAKKPTTPKAPAAKKPSASTPAAKKP
ncbi:alpha/beta hydrolase [Phenylobacterium sp.]|jgi:lysophospholipase|uniref:alpha/beta hydrolase n=1 Tax=Phenylobacterium sp. TaxID=1871053 RepID=UPI002F3E3F0D